MKTCTTIIPTTIATTARASTTRATTARASTAALGGLAALVLVGCSVPIAATEVPPEPVASVPAATTVPAAPAPAASVPDATTPTISAPPAAAMTTAPVTTAPATTAPPAVREPEIDPAVHAELRAMGGWSTPTHVSTDDRPLTDESWTSGRTRTTCAVEPAQTISRTFDELAAFPFDGPLVPGLVVEGAGVLDGELRPVPLDRAPIVLVSSLDSEHPTVRVEAPGTATLQEAVTALKRDADAQFTGVDVTPADITYVRREAHSFEQAFSDMGLSARYASPGLRAQFESSFEQQSQVERHSIVVRLVQPMFTIRAATDAVVEPGDHFAPSTSVDDVRRLAAGGRMGADNVPTLVESVTYGRVMYFTMTSSTVASASELEVAVEAAWGGVGGTADLTEAQRQVLSESRIDVIAFGGDQDVAFRALRSGDLGDFFSSVNTTTAAPLSMTMRTLTGERVELADEVTFRSVTCRRSEIDRSYEVSVSRLNGFAEVFVNDRSLGVIDGPTSGTVAIPADRLRPGGNTIRVEYGDWFPCLDGSVTAGVLVDGRARAERTHVGPACWFTWEWSLDTDRGEVAAI